MKNHTLRMPVLESLIVLESRIAQWRQRLLKHDQPAVLVMQESCTRFEAIHPLTTIYYADDQPPERTLVHPGLITSTDAELADGVAAVNAAKAEFRQRRLDYLKALGVEQSRLRSEALRDLLTALDRSRLHLLQCDRRWNLLPPDTLKVGFSWCQGGKSIRRTSVGALRMQLLEKTLEDPGELANLSILEGLPDSEPLAFAKDRGVHIRANAVRADGSRLSILASAPLLCLGSQLPEHNRLSSVPPIRDRLRRSDRTVSEYPLIPELNVFPYRGTRAERRALDQNPAPSRGDPSVRAQGWV